MPASNKHYPCFNAGSTDSKWTSWVTLKNTLFPVTQQCPHRVGWSGSVEKFSHPHLHGHTCPFFSLLADCVLRRMLRIISWSVATGKYHTPWPFDTHPDSQIVGWLGYRKQCISSKWHQHVIKEIWNNFISSLTHLLALCNIHTCISVLSYISHRITTTLTEPKKYHKAAVIFLNAWILHTALL